MYAEHPVDLDGAVVWSLVGAPGELRVVPDGCLDIIWSDGELVVAGPDTRAQVFTSTRPTTSVGVRFAPGQGPGLLGVPADELTDRQVRLDALWPAAEVRTLAARLDGADRPAALAAFVHSRLSTVDNDRLVREVARRLRAGHRVDATADAVGLSARHLHRRSLVAFGYGPKTLARVLRFTRAVDLARTGVDFATVAATTGYTDQAHLARDVRALAGISLGALTGRS